MLKALVQFLVPLLPENSQSEDPKAKQHSWPHQEAICIVPDIIACFVLKVKNNSVLTHLCLVAMCLPDLMALLLLQCTKKEKKTALDESVQINVVCLLISTVTNHRIHMLYAVIQ